MNTTQHPKFLRIVLRLNGTFSLLSGLSLCLAAGPLAEWIGLSRGLPLKTTGALLLMFAASLLHLSFRDRIDARVVRFIIAMDIGWVLLTGAWIALGVFNTCGNIVAVILAAIVGWFARLQAVGLRNLVSKA